jgi:signal transduction histidine kinase
LSHSLIDSLPIGVLTFGPDLKIIEANARAAELIALEGYVDKSLAKGTDHPASPGSYWTDRLKLTVLDGKTNTFDNVHYTFNGKTRLLRIGATPLKDSRTKEALGALIIEDLTENLHMKRHVADLERLAALGRLACKVAHELNNPMDGILRYINLTLRTVEQKKLQKPKEYLTHCRQGLMRMVRIVSDLLEFSRSTGTPVEYDTIEHLIDDAVKTMVPKTEPVNVRIVRHYTPQLPQIRSGNLFQVFCNIVKNALDAMPHGGRLTIATHLAADDTAAVEFRDTGVGFAPEHADLLFQPFFTTKNQGKGTGLGLAICKDIVERYHGRITAENALTGGSIFTVYLPLTDVSC